MILFKSESVNEKIIPECALYAKLCCFSRLDSTTQTTTKLDLFEMKREKNKDKIKYYICE